MRVTMSFKYDHLTDDEKKIVHKLLIVEKRAEFSFYTPGYIWSLYLIEHFFILGLILTAIIS